MYLSDIIIRINLSNLAPRTKPLISAMYITSFGLWLWVSTLAQPSHKCNHEIHTTFKAISSHPANVLQNSSVTNLFGQHGFWQQHILQATRTLFLPFTHYRGPANYDKPVLCNEETVMYTQALGSAQKVAVKLQPTSKYVQPLMWSVENAPSVRLCSEKQPWETYHSQKTFKGSKWMLNQFHTISWTTVVTIKNFGN